MWTCSGCGEDIEEQFEACWKCAAQRSGVNPSSGERSEVPGPDYFQLQARGREESGRFSHTPPKPTRSARSRLRYCSSCGAQLPRGCAFCPECGVSVHGAHTASSPPLKSRGENRQPWGLLLLLIPLSFVGWCALSQTSNITQDSPGTFAISTPEPSADPSRLTAAHSVMANARTLCRIYEESPHLVVECFTSILQADRLGFARAISDADAVITGAARNIYFYLPGGQKFAQADPVRGVRLTQ